jgi:hypothetical protein
MQHHPHLDAIPFVLEPEDPEDRLVESVVGLNDVVVDGVHGRVNWDAHAGPVPVQPGPRCDYLGTGKGPAVGQDMN